MQIFMFVGFVVIEIRLFNRKKMKNMANVHAATDRNVAIMNFDPSQYIRIVFIIIRNTRSYVRSVIIRV